MSEALGVIAVDTRAAAQMVGLSERTVRDLCNEGRVDSRYHGRKRLVLVDSLRAYVESLPIEKAKDPPT